MSIIVFEKFVMDVMISGCAQSQSANVGIPGEAVFGMNHGKPIGVDTPECHVGPHIGSPNNHGSTIEGDENHAYRIGHGPIEGIKETWIGKLVMWFVGCLIERG